MIFHLQWILEEDSVTRGYRKVSLGFKKKGIIYMCVSHIYACHIYHTHTQLEF